MDQFFGVIKILKVENIFPDQIDDQSVGTIMLMDHIRFVHYPDSQQLILWLPEYFQDYSNIIISNVDNNDIIFDDKVEDVISGSIQILIDTLFIYPGEFKLTIQKKDGLQHIINVKKYPEGIYPVVPVVITELEPEEDKASIIYQDGFGNILPNEDLLLRDKIISKSINKITRRLEYVSQGRDGEVIYIEGEKHIKFLMETGAYDCVFYVNIPSVAEWEKTTNFPSSERDDIITFVAEQTQRDQAPSCDFRILEKEIAYYKK